MTTPPPPSDDAPEPPDATPGTDDVPEPPEATPGADPALRIPSAAGRRPRRRTLIVAAVSLAVVAGGFTGWQLRTAQAAERREQVTEQAAAELLAQQKEAAARAARTPSPIRTPTSTPTPSPTPTPTPTAEAPAPAPPPAPAPSARPAGAGPDCGGPGSYQAPAGDGSAVFHTSTPTASGDGSNGRIPASAMAPLAWCEDSAGNKQWLRADAAAALTRLNEAFRAEFGENIAVDLSYRSYELQVAMRDHYGSIAARPGTSNHGWGTAIDTWEWAAYSFGGARYEWLVVHAPDYGWGAPSWARAGGSNPEYWHFEYTG